MAHTLQDRYSSLVDEKLRATLVTKDNIIFSNRYEGTPKAGKVKIPVRDTEVTVGDYNKATGLTLASGTTTYLDLSLDKDKGVNEIIDGYDAAAVPDGIVAERLDSAGYSLAAQVDADSISCLESNGTINATKTALTASTVYAMFVDLRTALSNSNVPTEQRWAIVSPDVYGLLLKDTTNFVRACDLAQKIVETGAIGQIAGFTVYESSCLMSGNTALVSSKTTSTEIIVGHPLWCHRVMEWEVPVGIKDLTNTYIGASAVQGRKIYGVKISKAAAVIVKRKEV